MVGEDDPDGLILGLNAEELVAEGHRRMQVWPNLTSLIPSPETVLRLAPSPSFDPSCTREEWGLLALVDGNRSVSEIVALLGRSEFAVAGALAALVERGLLTVDAAGSGLEDLQRRQAIIAGLESHGGDRAPPRRAPEPVAEPRPGPTPRSTQAADVPSRHLEPTAPPPAERCRRHARSTAEPSRSRPAVDAARADQRHTRRSSRRRSPRAPTTGR